MRIRRYLVAAGTTSSAEAQMSCSVAGPRHAMKTLTPRPQRSATYKASLSVLKASFWSPAASAVAKSDVVATLSQKKRYAELSTSIVAGPSAASSVAEHEPTTAVSTTLITSEESKAASVGTIKQTRSAV